MKISQLWFELRPHGLRVWFDSALNPAQAKMNTEHRLGVYQGILLYELSQASASPLGWTSFPWQDAAKKLSLPENFWPGLFAARFPFMNKNAVQAQFKEEFNCQLPLASDVVFYGGSFDPWHAGHQACLDLLPAELPLIIAPDKNPHKPTREIHPSNDFLQLSELAKNQVKRPYFHIYPGFLLQEEKTNPTVFWVAGLKRNRPDLRIQLLMGYDSFKALPSWTKSADLLKLVSGLWVVSRLEHEQEHQADLLRVLEFNPQLTVTFLGHHPHENLASRHLR